MRWEGIPVSRIDTLQEKIKLYFRQRSLRKLSMTGRLCYLFLCIEAYLVGCYPDRDWTPVAKRLWQWTNGWWNDGCDTYSAVVPEFLFEFDSYKETSQSFDGLLSEADYLQLTRLFSGLTVGCVEDELNQVLMLPISFCNECEGVDLGRASQATMWIFDEMAKFLALHDIPPPDVDRLRHMRGGWGGFLESESLSIVLKRDQPSC